MTRWIAGAGRTNDRVQDARRARQAARLAWARLRVVAIDVRSARQRWARAQSGDRAEVVRWAAWDLEKAEAEWADAWADLLWYRRTRQSDPPPATYDQPMSTWEERMAARAEARAKDRRLGYDTIAAAERAELQRWAILPPPDGAAGPPIESWSPWFRVCLECYPAAGPAPTRYVWSAADGRWVRPAWDTGPHVWGLHEPTIENLRGETRPRLGTCQHWCHYAAWA